MRAQALLERHGLGLLVVVEAVSRHADDETVSFLLSLLARATFSIPNGPCSPGRRTASVGLSSGPASAANPLLSDYQGRDLRVEAELALDADGTFLAVRSSHLSDLGAHAATFVSLQKGTGILSAVYHIPVAFVRGRGAFTNTAQTAPYRSAGRPEVIFVIERLIVTEFEPPVPPRRKLTVSSSAWRETASKYTRTGRQNYCADQAGSSPFCS